MTGFSTYGEASGSDSGVFLLDPEERALLRAAAQRQADQETEAEAHRRFLQQARELPAVRLKKVLRLREEIAQGRFVTKERLEGTVERLLERLR